MFNDYLVSHNLTRMLRTRKKAGRKPRAKAQDGRIINKQQSQRSSASTGHHSPSNENDTQPDHDDLLRSPRRWDGPGLRVNMQSGQIEYMAMTAAGTSHADETSLIDQLNDMRLSPESALAEKSIQVEILGRELRRQAEQSAEERQQAMERQQRLKVAETETRKLSMQLERANEYIAELEGQNSMLRQELQRAQADD